MIEGFVFPDPGNSFNEVLRILIPKRSSPDSWVGVTVTVQGPIRDYTKKYTARSKLLVDFQKGVNDVNFPERAHTLENTDYSTLENNFQKGVYDVNTVKKGYEYRTSGHSDLETDVRRNVRSSP